MQTSLSHLPESKQEELNRITKLIVETVRPEKVILYGSYATNKWQEDRYTEGLSLRDFDSDYDFLVITKPGELKKDYEISSQIVNRARFRVPVNVITHDIDYINDKLSIGHYYFTEIIQQGILLYDRGEYLFSEPKQLTVEERRKIAVEDFNNWFSSAKEFLEGARFYLNRGQNKIANFQLHQAVERTFNTILLVFTGYKPKSHNLSKLKTLIRGIEGTKEINSIFPCDNDFEEHLFTLLQKGYIEARYDSSYSILEIDLLVLIERVEELQKVTEILCQEKIASFS